MAELSNLYAGALLAIADEGGRCDEFMEQALLIIGALDNDDCRVFLASPRIKPAQKHTFLEEAFGGRVSPALLDFMRLAVDKGREKAILPALSELVRLLEQRSGKARASVLSAFELTREQETALRELLSLKLAREVELTVTVDSSVIGGLHVYAEGLLADLTVAAKLRGMRDGLRAAHLQ